MTNSKIYIAIALLLGLAGGYLYGSANSYNSGYSAGYDKASADIKSRLETRKIIPPAPKEMKIISGTIRSIGNNQFVLESRMPFDPTLSDSQQNSNITKTVLVVPATKIFVREVVKGAVKNVAADFKSLKVSEQVVVEAAKDISGESYFEAVTIFKNSQ